MNYQLLRINVLNIYWKILLKLNILTLIKKYFRSKKWPTVCLVDYNDNDKYYLIKYNFEANYWKQKEQELDQIYTVCQRRGARTSILVSSSFPLDLIVKSRRGGVVLVLALALISYPRIRGGRRRNRRIRREVNVIIRAPHRRRCYTSFGSTSYRFTSRV